MPHPASVGLSLQPKPGSDGQTTWNASDASPPCAVGSTSGPITSWNSTTDPGQPWVITMGRASSCGERAWRKWMPNPSMAVRNWGKALNRASAAAKS